MQPSLDRRRFVASGAAALALPYVRSARAAGTLAVGFWDHFVPGANEPLTKLCQEWGAKEKVELKVEFISGNQLGTIIAGEAQSRTGHDILTFPVWYAQANARHLEPVDDVMAALVKQYGRVAAAAEFIGKSTGRWVAVPAITGTQVQPPVARLDLFRQHAGLDLRAMFPPSAPPAAEAENWTWDTLLAAAEKLHKAGSPIGLGLGQTADSACWTGSLFASHGAELVDANGRITVASDPVRQVLQYMQRLAKLMPEAVFAWDDTSNNKYLLSGQGSLIMNPPSVHTVAKRDGLKLASDLWTFQMPKGPKGRFVPYLPFFWGVWGFSKNKAAARSLLTHLQQRENVERMVTATHGYDIPSFESMRDFKVWEQVDPPTGTVYHYPPRHDQVTWLAGMPAPVGVAHQIFVNALMPKMIAKCTQGGEPIDKVIAWAKSELEAYSRN